MPPFTPYPVEAPPTEVPRTVGRDDDATGIYLTDGSMLFRMLAPFPGDDDFDHVLRLEDACSLEVVHILEDDLPGWGLRLVHPA